MIKPREPFDVDDFVEEQTTFDAEDGEIELPSESLEDYLLRMSKNRKPIKKCQK